MSSVGAKGAREIRTIGGAGRGCQFDVLKIKRHCRTKAHRAVVELLRAIAAQPPPDPSGDDANLALEDAHVLAFLNFIDQGGSLRSFEKECAKYRTKGNSSRTVARNIMTCAESH